MNDIYLMDRSRQRLTLEGVDYAAHDLPRLRAMAEERADDFLRERLVREVFFVAAVFSIFSL